MDADNQDVVQRKQLPRDSRETYFNREQRKKNNKVKAKDGEPNSRPKPEDIKWELRHGYVGQSPRLVAVPTHFFKVILAERKNSSQLTVAAFVLPNQSIEPNAKISKFAVELTDIEKAIGMRLFPELVYEQQDLSETIVDLRTKRARAMVNLCEQIDCTLSTKFSSKKNQQ